MTKLQLPSTSQADEVAKAIAAAGEHGPQVKAIIESSERLAWHANMSLQVANRSQNVASRSARLAIVRDNIRRLKETAKRFAFLSLTSFDAFEDSVGRVEAETDGLRQGRSIAGGASSQSAANRIPSPPLRIRKVAELINSEIAFAKGASARAIAAAITNCEPADDTGPQWKMGLIIGEGQSAKTIVIDISPIMSAVEYDQSASEPVYLFAVNSTELVLFRHRFFLAERRLGTIDDYQEVILRAKKMVYDEEAELSAIRASVFNLETAAEYQRNGPKREPITDDVKTLVWTRDGGVCVRCGSAERLHFDHVIPVAKGGSGEAVNIQLLCQPCNLRKSDKIAF